MTPADDSTHDTTRADVRAAHEAANVAQGAATVAQGAATLAQDAATVSQNAANLAQDRATGAHDTARTVVADLEKCQLRDEKLKELSDAVLEVDRKLTEHAKK